MSSGPICLGLKDSCARFSHSGKGLHGFGPSNLGAILKWIAIYLLGRGGLFVSPCVGQATTPAQLPSGMFSTSGNQIISVSGGTPVRLACTDVYGLEDAPYGYSSVADPPYFADIGTSMQHLAAAGFNCVRVSYTSKGFHDGGNMFSLMDALVTAAGRSNIRVILDHHNDEGADDCVAQQANGDWYDKGGNTKDTNGCGTVGTITAAIYQRDQNSLASRYASNNTVIGYELDNEPLALGNSLTPPGVTWGDGGQSDIQAMANSVGSSMLSYDSSKLIFVPCPFHGGYDGKTTLFDGSTSSVAAPWGDCTGVKAHPVSFTVGGNPVTNKTVYTVHLYPASISGVNIDSGPSVISAYNQSWGFLYTGSSPAPVMVTEIGDPLTNSEHDTWGNFAIAYLNGQDGTQGGPSFSGSQQPIGTVWFAWTASRNLAVLNSDGSLDAGPRKLWSQLLYHPSASAPPPLAIPGLSSSRSGRTTQSPASERGSDRSNVAGR